MSERPDYFSRVNPNLLDAIPPDCQTVLEVGCGSGALARAYKARNPTCRYYGSEIDRLAAAEAERSGYFEAINKGGVRDESWQLFAIWPDDFDCLVFGDVLEHLEDPWGQLKTCVGWLRPGGTVVASIPSIGHYGAILHLMCGDWEYQNEGLLDRTHLRWFTRKTAVKLFEQAGLTVVKVAPVGYKAENFKEFIAAIKNDSTWEKFGVNIPQLERDGDKLQFVITGVKGEAPANKVLIRAFGGPPCCQRPRLTEPGVFLNTIPGVRYSETKATVEKGESVIVVRQRAKWDLTEVRKQIAAGAVIVGEWDDEPETAVRCEGSKIDVPLAIRGCHAIQVSTERMAETIRKWNPNVAVFPNQLMEIPPPREYAESDTVRIFFGAQNRESDWKPIMPALNRVLKEFEDRIFVEVVCDKEFYHALELPPGKRKTFRPFMAYEKYRALLRKCDIALLPLEPTEFNEHKSDIKLLECAAEGVATLASKTIYARTMLGSVYADEEGFEKILRSLINDPEKRRVSATYAYNYVRDNRLLKDHYRDRLAWYQDLLARKAELDEQLRLRAPELFAEIKSPPADD